MTDKPTFKELEQRLRELESKAELHEESKKRLRKMQTILNDTQALTGVGGWEYDVIAGHMTWTDEVYRIYGVSPDEYDPNDIDQDVSFYTPEAQAVILAAFERALEQGEPYDLDLIFRAADGSDKFVRTIGQVERREGRIVRVFGNIMDITERKRSEAALRESEAKFRNIFDNAQVGIFRTRLIDGKVIECNDRFAKTFGYSSRKECIAEYVSSDHYADPGIRERMLARLQAEGEVNDFEARFTRRDGVVVWIRFSARSYPDRGYLEGVGYDITQEKNALEALRASEENYRRIFENIQDVYYETALDGTILEVSPSIEKVSQYKRKDLLGSSLYDIYTSAQERDNFIKTMLRNGKVNDYEITMRDGDGSLHLCSIATSLIRDGQGDPVKLVGSLRDISERKQNEEEKKKLEDQLHRAQKMESLGLMAGGIAHDLNNILSGIVSYPDLLLMDLPRDSPLRKPIETIKNSGMRAADVVADLLTIARGVASDKETLHINDVVAEYMASAEHQRLQHRHPFIEFRTDLDANLLNMSGSLTHIKKTLMNLVINAGEAMQGSGTVIISTQNRYLDDSRQDWSRENIRQGEYVVLSVSDQGPGISPEDMERIFEPFYTKKVLGRSGTGLGLAVVWNTVQDHKGYINVTTGAHGTTFDLYFPATREPVTGQEPKISPDDYLGNGERILVVDDEEKQREIACGMLRRLGYDPEAVPGGDEAIEYVRQRPVDLIVLDMVMPKGLNGRETYEQIMKIRPEQKAIIASGYARTREVDAAQKLGAGEYLRKPYTLEKLGVAVKQAMEK